MKLLSLQEFKTGLEYHDHLNPVLWNWQDDTLLPDVRVALAKIANDFITFLGIDRMMVADVAITGSNCNYNYSPQSDIDLHVIATYAPDHKNDLSMSIQDSFDAFKTLYNEERHIKVHGFPIEVYVQPTSEHFTSNAGVYSLTKGMWIQRPVKTQVDLDNREIQRKAKPVMKDIDDIVHGKMAGVLSRPRIQAVKARIKQLRAAGLEAGGEFGVENLAFKAIRNAGYLDKLSKYSEALKDSSLSI